MDDSMSELNERLTASCRETLQQLDDIEAKLAGLHQAIARSAGPQIAPAVTAVTAARWTNISATGLWRPSARHSSDRLTPLTRYAVRRR